MFRMESKKLLAARLHSNFCMKLESGSILDNFTLRYAYDTDLEVVLKCGFALLHSVNSTRCDERNKQVPMIVILF